MTLKEMKTCGRVLQMVTLAYRNAKLKPVTGSSVIVPETEGKKART